MVYQPRRDYRTLGTTTTYSLPTTFTNEAFFAFQKTNSLALTEAEMMAQPVATVAGDTNIFSQRKLLFDHLEPLTDGKIAKAKPGWYDGA